MGKLLLWFVIILAGLTAWRITQTHKANKKAHTSHRKTDNTTPPSSTKVEPMVRCAYCGIYLPHSEASLTQGQTWCSLEHAQQGVKP